MGESVASMKAFKKLLCCLVSTLLLCGCIILGVWNETNQNYLGIFLVSLILGAASLVAMFITAADFWFEFTEQHY